MSKLVKRLLYVGVAVILLVTLSVFGFAQEQVDEPVGYEPECYQHGDMNGDGIIDNLDAFYTLYHMMYEEEFPLRQEQDWDFDHNGDKDNIDAFYLLYHVMFQDDPDFAPLYQLNGVIHDYYDPSWVWTEDAGNVIAQVTFKCGCGAPVTYTQANGVTVTAGTRVEATCMQAGSAPYTAQIEVGGKTYENTYTKTLPASGSHNMVGIQSCEGSSVCDICGFTLEAKGHSWVLNEEKSTAATCSKQAVQWYDCSVCEDTKEVTLEGVTGHTLQYLEDRQNGCEFVKWYQCADCKGTFAGTAASDTYYKHDYKATLTKEANCAEEGLKTYTCACGATYTETVSKNDSHLWVAGEPDAKGVTTHTCSRGCGATKTTVSAVNNAVTTENLQNNELQLKNNASMKLDQDTVEALQKDIVVSVETVPPQEAGLSEEEIAQLGDSVVYDFNMTYSDGSAITDEGAVFAGEVTISLPYDPDIDEDVDSIQVWYIADNGELTAVKATYSNGFVTFTTKHFSYYTVTRLTPAQRCELYGHMLVHSSKAVTCTQDGYEMSVCSRCGKVEKNDIKKSQGHDYGDAQTIKAATCTAEGSFKKVCGTCEHTVTGIIPATGHNMVEDPAQAQAATCTKAGKVVHVCQNNCGYSRIEESLQLGHNYIEGEAQAATCTGKGYRQKTCDRCGDTVLFNEQAPLGHSFSPKNARWTWNENHTVATVTLVCDHNGTHTKDLSAVVTEKKVAASCNDPGTVIYTATASFNNVSYEDVCKIATDSAVGHTPDESQWLTTDKTHYHLCTVCGGRADEMDHKWDEGTVTKEATCGEKGSVHYTCAVCEYETDMDIPATKQHDFVDGTCTVCGAPERSCIHGRKTGEVIDLSMYDICEGAKLVKYSCECGEEVEYLCDWNCAMGEEQKRIELDENGEEICIYYRTCADCGLTYEYWDYAELLEDECVKNYGQIEQLTLGDTVLVEYKWVGMGEEHPGVEVVKTTTFAAEEYGLCGDLVFEERVCPCGEKTDTYIPIWECGPKMETVEEGKLVCPECGLTNIYDYRYEQIPCGELEIYTGSYYMGETLLYSFSTTWEYEDHDYKADDYQLFGTSCKDGIAIFAVCKDCGHETTAYYEEDEHIPVIEGYIDLSQYDLCAKGIKTYKCPCEYAYESFVWDTDDGSEGCEWGDAVENEDGSITQTCPTCGLVGTVVHTETEKDENCGYFESYDATLFLADGTQIAQVCMRAYQQDHELEETYELEGMTCDDGVTITRTCKNCDYVSTRKNACCEYTICEEYDLSNAGTCIQGVTVWRCPCGRMTRTEGLWGYECKWVPAAGDEGVEIYRCEVCGTELEDRRGEPVPTEDPCYNKCQRGYILRKDDQELLNITWEQLVEDHNVVLELKLNEGATDCTGGYTWSEHCLDCDYENSGEDDSHQRWYTGKQEVGDGKLCSPAYLETYTCACGKENGADLFWEGECCDFQQMKHSYGSDITMYECLNCHAVYAQSYQEEPVEGDPCLRLCTWSYTYSDAEGNDLFSYESTQLGERHRYVYTFDEGSCDTGYTVTGTCLDCGEVMVMENYHGCNSGWIVEREVALDLEGTCGAVEKVHYVCPCGRYDYYDVLFACNTVYSGYLPKMGDVYTCTDCGLEYYNYTDAWPGEGCEMIMQQVYVLTFAEETYTVQYEESSYNHDYLYTFEPRGDGGYYIYGDCADCDATETIEIDGCDGHGMYVIQHVDLKDLGMCGGTIRITACPCGEETHVYSEVYSCNLTPTGNYHPDLGIMEMQCSFCNATRYYDEQLQKVPGACRREGTFYFIAAKDGVELVNIAAPVSETVHDMRNVNVTLNNPEGTCEEGVTYTFACRNCDYAYECGDYGRHVQEEVEYVDLTAMGACSGYMTYSECPCGKSAGVDYYETCPDLRTSNWQGQEDDGYTHYYQQDLCEDCGLRILRNSYVIKREGTCIDDWYVTYTVTMGEQTETFSYVESQTCHDMDYTYTLPEGVTSCDGGVIETGVCTQCGDTTQETYYHHKEYVVKNINLAEHGGCGGVIVYSACACGQQKSEDLHYGFCPMASEDTSYYTDEQGRDHTVWTRTCSECGMVLREDSYKLTYEGTCKIDRYTTLTVTIGDFSDGYQVHYAEEEHDYNKVLTLLNKDGDCKDGVDRILTCKNCDYYYHDTVYDHEVAVLESYDMSQFGAVCGGSVEQHSCACGANQGIEFIDKGCRWGTSETDHFVEGTIDEYQPHINYIGTYSESYIYRCSVTDPESCGLVIRYSRYWLKEGCWAVEYQTWQFGYNEEDGTYQEEITFATGGKHTYHAYTKTENTTKQDDGGSLVEVSYVCEDCSSSYILRNYYHADGHSLKQEEIYTNTMNDGCNSYQKVVYEWEMQESGRNEEVRYYYKSIDAYGTEYWREVLSTYDPTNPCRKTQVENTSEGDGEPVIVENHSGSPYYEHKEFCTQYGYDHWWSVCSTCQNAYDESWQEVEPADHDWQRNDELDIWVCSVCGLENSNGASGSIVMEDLTESHGNGENYVVGYWNRGYVSFNPHLNVVLDDVTDGDNQIDLEFTAFTTWNKEANGVNAVVFNANDAKAAAAAAVAQAGYTGSYALRISFVPMGSTTLDYAITFDSVTAQ